MNKAADCWVLTTGEAGMVSQATGLAAALGVTFETRTVDLRRPWRWLPGHWQYRVLNGLTPDSDPVVPPWPELLIACGRRSTGIAIAIQRSSGGKTFTVYIQDPQIPARYFDLVVAPAHDHLSGDNVITSRGAINHINADVLAQARAQWSAVFAALPRPLVAVLIGGSNRHARMSTSMITQLITQLRTLSGQGAGLAITTSRRTGSASTALLQEGFANRDGCYFWDGNGENPYKGLLACADHILVTGDSVSMVSEACSTGKPVQVIDLANYGKRLQRFHADLRAAGITRPFSGKLEQWSYPALNEAEKAARHIQNLLATKQ
ncbi:MAG: mitochondrial fission ELM1 family protein [Gammaproteobacteria bacterium]